MVDYSKIEEQMENLQKKANEINDSEQSLKNFQRFIFHAIILIVVVWVLFWKIVGITAMPNNDMYPRIDSGDMMMFYRLDKDPKVQDIIVFKRDKTRYVGRVIAVGGDTVNITENDLLEVNGNTLVESNVFEKTPRYISSVHYPLTVPQGEVFVLVDHRDGGEDSRYLGTISRSEIEGTVINIMRRHNL